MRNSKKLNFKTPVIILCIGVFCVLYSCISSIDSLDTEKDIVVSSEYIDSVIANEDYETAFNLILGGFEQAKLDKNYIEMSKSSADISALYREALNYELAIKYGKEALNWADSSSNDVREIQADINLGKAYLGYYNRGEDGVKNLRYEKMIDSAYFYFSKALDKSRFLHQKGFKDTLNFSLVESLASIYSNLSAISFTEDKLDEAESSARESLEFYLEIEDTLRTAIPLNNIGNVELLRENYTDAAKYYRQAIEILDEYGDKNEYLKDKADLLVNYAFALNKLNRIEAYNVFNEAYELEWDLAVAERDKMLAELEKKYNVKRIEEEAAAKQKEKEIEAEQFKYFSILLFILTLVLIATFFVFYKGSQLKQKNLELQIDKEQLVQKAELERVEKLSQTKVLNATIDGRESERKLIAEILHDSVSSLLSSANLHLQASRNVYSEVPEEIDKSQRIIEEASEKIRNLSHELISSVLLKFGLSYSIFDLCEKYSNSQIEIVSDINRVRRYDQSFEIKMNNIIEELVNNILKHSKATEAIITLEERNDQLFLEITDNGEGLKFDELIKKDGLGLNQIKARVQMMKGSIDIDSIPTQGTTINIIVPIVEREVRKREMA
ncbi:MAG: tetratricopeptide repeat protein [Flavobacteriaceae bacterium]